MKLNIGSHNIRVEGYVNIDGLDLENVDIVSELHLTPYEFDIKADRKELLKDHIEEVTRPDESIKYRFKTNSIEEIISTEFLEHISFKDTIAVLKEWNRILRPMAKVFIQVPDCGQAMGYYVNNEICDCVPHKGTNAEQVADPSCFSCGGRAKINPNRWLYSFTGAQKHKYDSHLNIFTKERMSNFLVEAGFKAIEFKEDKFKIKVTAEK